MLSDDAQRLLALYPRIFLACHTRHVRDPKTSDVVSSHQASILDHLDDVEPTSLMTLAMHMGVTASTMSIGTDRLVRGGYVTRERDPRDARRVQLRLTEAGLRIRRQQSVLDRDLVLMLLKLLSAEERAQSLRGLALLADAATELMKQKSLRGARTKEAT